MIVPLAIAAALVAAAPAAAPKPRTVTIADNYYVPAKLTVKQGHEDRRGTGPTRPATSTTSSSRRRPRGSKKFHSQPASASYYVQAQAGKAGEYKIVCTLHEEMPMTITVAEARSVRPRRYVRGRGQAHQLPELRVRVPPADALRGAGGRRGARRPALLGLHDVAAGAAHARGHGGARPLPERVARRDRRRLRALRVARTWRRSPPSSGPALELDLVGADDFAFSRRLPPAGSSARRRR